MGRFFRQRQRVIATRKTVEAREEEVPRAPFAEKISLLVCSILFDLVWMISLFFWRIIFLPRLNDLEYLEYYFRSGVLFLEYYIWSITWSIISGVSYLKYYFKPSYKDDWRRVTSKQGNNYTIQCNAMQCNATQRNAMQCNAIQIYWNGEKCTYWSHYRYE